MQLPVTNIGGLEVSRVLCGTNTFLGYSHFSAAKDEWLRNYFNVDRMVEVMLKCAEFGVNALVSPPMDVIQNALEITRKETGKDFHWICTPGGDDDNALRESIKWCADRDVKICMPHTCYTDIRLDIKNQEIEGLPAILDYIRECGMIPGLSTHRPEVLTVSQAAGYDVETCILPFNVDGFLCPVETDWVARVINGYKKPIICIKPFAAGRVMPKPGLEFVFRNNKPIDTVCAGFLSPQEAEEDLKIALEILTGMAAEISLTYSRSKQALVPKAE